MQISKEQSTFLKGVAVIFVILSHFIGGGYDLRIFTPFGGIGVALFLLLSGFGLNESYYHSGLVSFWWKKLTRIGVPWLIWCMMFFLIGLAVPSLSKTHFIIRYWYLEYLIIWCLVFWIGRKIVLRRKMFLTFIAVVSIIMFFIWPCLKAEQSLSFTLGVFLSESNHQVETVKNSKHKKWLCVLPIILFFYATMFLFIKQIPEIRAFGEESLLMKVVQMNIKLPYALSVVLFFVRKKVPQWVGKIMIPIGLLSLELYLVQMEFFPYIQGHLTVLLLVTAVVVMLSILLHYLVKIIDKPLKAVNIKL